MTITRIWQAGFESGSVYEFDACSLTIDTNPKTGTYNVKNAGGYLTGSKSFTPTYQIRTGFYFNCVSTYYSINIFTAGEIGLTFDNSTGFIQLYVNGVLKGTSKNIVTGYTHIGLDIKKDASVGWAYLYLDGSENISFDGNTIATQNSIVQYGTFSGNTLIGTTRYDDIYLDDTTGEAGPNAPPIKKFYPLNVNGDGAYSQWTIKPSGTNHYEMVDERPPDDDTTYLEAVTGSLLDSFTMTTFTLDTNENIMAMIPFAFAKRGSTTEKISLGTISSGTILLGTDQDMSTSYGYVWERQPTGSLGFEWNQSYMDSVEVVINSTGTY